MSLENHGLVVCPKWLNSRSVQTLCMSGCWLGDTPDDQLQWPFVGDIESLELTELEGGTRDITVRRTSRPCSH